ncbi:hypothetical protein NDU88_002663 [Pleurodeles waltl]|uniref:Uncharacterized protein n=1 Tax=Pleurodeles waltl TaxID=8319 RepID=A0AAV7LEQ8_PLEWA|nr:hypothetical protein NDU88_002663 [Pleurodeles waltl]
MMPATPSDADRWRPLTEWPTAASSEGPARRKKYLRKSWNRGYDPNIATETTSKEQGAGRRGGEWRQKRAPSALTSIPVPKLPSTSLLQTLAFGHGGEGARQWGTSWSHRTYGPRRRREPPPRGTRSKENVQA